MKTRKRKRLKAPALIALPTEISRYDKAISDYTEAIRLNPNDALAYNNRGAAYRRRGNLAKAKADFLMANRLKTGQ